MYNNILQIYKDVYGNVTNYPDLQRFFKAKVIAAPPIFWTTGARFVRKKSWPTNGNGKAVAAAVLAAVEAAAMSAAVAVLAVAEGGTTTNPNSLLGM